MVEEHKDDVRLRQDLMQILELELLEIAVDVWLAGNDAANIVSHERPRNFKRRRFLLQKVSYKTLVRSADDLLIPPEILSLSTSSHSEICLNISTYNAF